MTKRTVSKSMLEIMESLAINGPSSKWDLSSRSSGRSKEGLTSLSYTLILRHIKYLQQRGFVKEYGIRKKPEKYPGHPRAAKRGEAKQEVTLYGLSFVGLSYIFMEDEEVREKWDQVKKNYQEMKFPIWFSLANNWARNLTLNIFPLRKQFGQVTRHYQPNPRLFVQSLLLPEVRKGEKEAVKLAYDEVINVLSEYGKSAIIPIYNALRKEKDNCAEVMERCEILLGKLEPLRYRRGKEEDDHL